mgnify:CR=1 FL=1
MLSPDPGNTILNSKKVQWLKPAKVVHAKLVRPHCKTSANVKNALFS